MKRLRKSIKYIVMLGLPLVFLVGCGLVGTTTESEPPAIEAVYTETYFSGEGTVEVEEVVSFVVYLLAITKEVTEDYQQYIHTQADKSKVSEDTAWLEQQGLELNNKLNTEFSRIPRINLTELLQHVPKNTRVNKADIYEPFRGLEVEYLKFKEQVQARINQ